MRRFDAPATSEENQHAALVGFAKSIPEGEWIEVWYPESLDGDATTEQTFDVVQLIPGTEDFRTAPRFADLSDEKLEEMGVTRA